MPKSYFYVIREVNETELFILSSSSCWATKAEYADFIVREELGYELAGEGEFVAVKIRKTNASTLFVGKS